MTFNFMNLNTPLLQYLKMVHTLCEAIHAVSESKGLTMTHASNVQISDDDGHINQLITFHIYEHNTEIEHKHECRCCGHGSMEVRISDSYVDVSLCKLHAHVGNAAEVMMIYHLENDINLEITRIYNNMIAEANKKPIKPIDPIDPVTPPEPVLPPDPEPVEPPTVEPVIPNPPVTPEPPDPCPNPGPGEAGSGGVTVVPVPPTPEPEPEPEPEPTPPTPIVPPILPGGMGGAGE